MRHDPQLPLEPLQVSKRQFAQLLSSPRLAQRALYHRLVRVTIEGGRGRETRIDYQSIKDFYRDWILAGRDVPLLPSEIRRQDALRSIKTISTPKQDGGKRRNRS